ncbi:hypothetical protein AHiyo1_28000 [Arthrobacter sp. Hiyo1]|nr:hypothetical protein AHiyo1_28000 [Arthrobacter sp. Hiyo1]
MFTAVCAAATALACWLASRLAVCWAFVRLWLAEATWLLAEACCWFACAAAESSCAWATASAFWAFVGSMVTSTCPAVTC